MSWTYYPAAWASPVSGTSKLVLLSLADHADDDGVAFPGLRRLSKHTGLSERSIIPLLRKLETAGLIEVEKGRQHYANRYRLKLARREATSSLDDSRGEATSGLDTLSDEVASPLSRGSHEGSSPLAAPRHEDSVTRGEASSTEPHRTVNVLSVGVGQRTRARRSPERPGGASRKPVERLAAGQYAAEFAAVRELYPSRAGDHGWTRAAELFAAARKGGEPLDVIKAGVERYGAYCSAEGLTGTKYVKKAVTFFGPERCWREKWAPSLRSRSRHARDSNFGRDASGFVG